MNILVAVDRSEHAQEAIRFVKSVDWLKPSRIYLIHIMEMKDAPPIMPSGGPSSWDRVIAEARGQLVTEAKHFLEQMKKTILEQRPVNIESIVVEGLPGAEILQAMKDYQIDLIVVGTRGLSKVKRFLLGSTSDWVLREASCSVLLVRGKLSQATIGKTAAKIILATDGSPDALNTVDALSLLTFKTPPKVTVTHVVAKPAYLEGWYLGKGKAEFEQLAEQLREKAQKDGAGHLEELGQKVKSLNMKVDSLLTKGDPADEILKTAERLKAKLIIIGAKGRTGSQAIPLGGIARKISRYAPCSVLVARPGTSQKFEE
jgi:nucleotide-binding universal stress UspA family protein